MGKLWRRIVGRLSVPIGVAIEERRREIARRTLPEFANGQVVVDIELPRRIVNPHLIEMGRDVAIGPGSFLAALTRYPPDHWRAAYPGELPEPDRFAPRLVIGDRVSASGSLTLAAMEEIVVEEDVMFASNINVTDAVHGFDHIDLPFKYQPMRRLRRICIGRGSWIGQNVVILPGVRIGRFAIVGANSVVTRDVPDGSVVVGAPARPIKHWDSDLGRWVEGTNHSS